MKEIKKRLENKLGSYLTGLDRKFGLSKISPLLFARIREFAMREGKRVRPTLFIVGYLGYAKKEAAGLYTSALSLELLHDFMLVHDDIIDRSDLRRGKPSMHKLFARDIQRWPTAKFNGEDLGIIAGDVMYAMALHSFLEIKENPLRKERALKKLIEAALFTGSGEFIEMVYGTKRMEVLTKEDIFKIYDLKTAFYTFSYPLTMGAIMGGASETQVRILSQYGRYLGRAFQIKDDIIGMFSQEKTIGKSTLTDLQESKKTLLMWLAYRKTTSEGKRIIVRTLEKDRATKDDLVRIRTIVTQSGALAATKKEISSLLTQALTLSAQLRVKPRYKKFLQEYPRQILSI